MPELPEVEVVRRGLEREIAGRPIVCVEATGARTIRRHRSDAELAEALVGRVVSRIDRHGKYLVFRVGANRALVVHLGMSGQLRYAPVAAQARLRHTHLVVGLEGGAEVRFVDPRTFGEAFVADVDDDGGSIAALRHLGPDALTGIESRRHLRELVTRRRTGLKSWLMDQRAIAGIGNIYSDEILFRSRLRWDRRTDSLSAPETGRLHDHLGETLREAVEHGGSSLRDAQYVDAYGRAGGFQHRHAVYGRAGAACIVCGRPIVRERFAGRSTFWCRRCQR